MGALNVIGTLWQSVDMVVALFMGRFYQYYLQENLSIPLAFCRTQQWLRESNCNDIREFIGNDSSECANELFEMLDSLINQETRPFEDPYFWACFTLIGRS